MDWDASHWILANGLCANCGGKGGTPGPCPHGGHGQGNREYGRQSRLTHDLESDTKGPMIRTTRATSNVGDGYADHGGKTFVGKVDLLD